MKLPSPKSHPVLTTEVDKSLADRVSSAATGENTSRQEQEPLELLAATDKMTNAPKSTEKSSDHIDVPPRAREVEKSKKYSYI